MQGDAADAPHDTRDAIVALEHEMDAALLRADTGWFERHWHVDALYVHLSGRTDTRASFVERVAARELVHLARETDELVVRAFGDTAIVTGRARSQMLVGGEEHAYDTRFTRVWVHDGDGWRLASSQTGANTAA